jgi:hypothetical protein
LANFGQQNTLTEGNSKMATDKKFAVTGTSALDGKTKVRFATDMTRVKILVKTKHTDIDLIDLPREMTKSEIAQYLHEINFANGRPEVAEAIADLAKKNKVALTTTPTATTADTAVTA